MTDAKADESQSTPGVGAIFRRASGRFLPTTEDGPDIDQILREASQVHWSDTTRLLVGLAALLGGFAVVRQLTGLVVPILIAVLLVLITRPAILWLSRRTGWSWTASVGLVYGVMVAIGVVVGLLLGSRVLAEVQGLADTLAAAAASGEAADAASAVASAPSQAVGALARLLLTAGGTLLSFTVNLVALAAFVTGAAFFTLVESKPGIAHRSGLGLGPFGRDMAPIGLELRRIWGKWIYGQIVLSALTFVSYFILLTLLGVENRLAISLISVVGRFIPYVGATITWAVLFVSAYTQPTNPFDWEPLTYALVAVGLAIVVDQSFDQLLVPKLFGTLLKLPTVVVMVGTIAMGMLMGFFGVFIAAPLMASVRVLGTWLALRLFDSDGEPP